MNPKAFLLKDLNKFANLDYVNKILHVAVPKGYNADVIYKYVVPAYKKYGIRVIVTFH